MKLYNPYTHHYINYPLDLSSDNIVLEYHITHETFFCSWHTSWCVAHLESGDVLYIPYGDRNRRNIYVVTPFYLDKTVSFPHGVYTLSYNEFIGTSSLNMPDDSYSSNNYTANDIDDCLDDSFDDDDFDFEEFFNNTYKPKYISFY